jgi:hypothetical protein
MRLEQMKVSPAQAREWLAVESDRPIRPIKAATMAKLRHALESGEWRLTHQAIALDPGGFVLDGRHRLTAIGEQRKHVPCLVAFDCDPETYQVIDTGTARTPADTLRVAGYTDVNVLAAAARQAHAYPLVVGGTDTLDSATGRMTSAEVLSIVESDEGKIVQDSLTLGTRLTHGVGRYGWRSAAAALVAVIAAHTNHGEDTQREFVNRLASGADLAIDSPILAYRRWLILDTGLASHPPQWRRTGSMALGIKAWNQYANGEERTTMRYVPGRSIMPEIT